jgi:hypothetical protein
MWARASRSCRASEDLSSLVQVVTMRAQSRLLQGKTRVKGGGQECPPHTVSGVFRRNYDGDDSELTLGPDRSLGVPRPNQGQCRHVIVSGGLTHKVLHVIDYGGAQFLGGLVSALL